MQVSFSPTRPDDADTIAFPVAKGALAETELALEAGDLVRDAAVAARFTGAGGQHFEIFVREAGRTLRLVLVGTGDRTDADHERAGGTLVARLQTSGARTVVVQGGGQSPAAIASFVLGAELRAWRMDAYRTRMPEASKPTLDAMIVVGTDGDTIARWQRNSAVAAGVAFARDLVTQPANIIYAESFVERCRELSELGIEITVLDEPEMRRLGMGALLCVSQGSARAPRLLALRWNGTGDATTAPVALIGKGVTFDTGGISIKPAAGMEDMKWDMGGAAAVAGAMMALAGRKAKAHVVGICGLVENMPDGKATRPGDVVTSMSGQTVEVINTDAEGRLVLCDAMHWAQETYAPKVMVDLATLTGAMIIALGHEHGGMFANDDELAGSLLTASNAVGEPLWRFPLSKAYDKLIDSPIADMKNVGPRGAGSITAAQYLQRFVHDGVKWAHLDIAGMVWADKEGPTWAKGATGYGVRLLDRFISDNFEG